MRKTQDAFPLAELDLFMRPIQSKALQNKMPKHTVARPMHIMLKQSNVKLGLRDQQHHFVDISIPVHRKEKKIKRKKLFTLTC